MQLGPAAYEFSIQWMRYLPLYRYSNRFMHFVADYTATEGAYNLNLCSRLVDVLRLTHTAVPVFSFATVRIRAISRRTLPNREVFANCPVAACMRRLNCSRNNSCHSLALSSADRALISFNSIASPAHTLFASSHELAGDKRGAHRQFRRRQPERITRDIFAHPFHLIQHATGLHYRDPIFRITFTLTHTHFQRLLGNGFIRKYAYPHATAAFDMTGQRAPRGFNLT